jgi:DNA modification methylase
MIAREISGEAIPNLIVYGGGQEIHDFCNQNSLVYIHDFMTEKGGENG